MNNEQVLSVYKVLGITTPVDNGITNLNGKLISTDIYQIGKTRFYFSGESSFIARNIPMEVAEIIYQKYQAKPLNIAVCGYGQNTDPKEYDDFGFLPYYSIDTYEGVIVFLSELKDYYARKEGLESTYADQYDELLSKVTENILAKSYPHVTSFNWMQSNQNKDKYNLYLRRSLKNKSVTKLRAALMEFEKAVNPYEIIDGTFDKPVNYLKRIKVSALPFTQLIGRNKKEECLQLTIKEIDGNDSYTYTRRDADGFYYVLKYVFPYCETIEVIYSYDKQYGGNYGELVSFTRRDMNDDIKVKYEFRIADKEIECIYDGQRRTYKKDDYIAMYNLTNKIIKEIEYATSLASSITLDNIRKQEPSRVREEVENK